MQFDLYSLIGAEGLVVFSVIAMLSFVLLRLFAPYSALSAGSFEIAGPIRRPALASKRKAGAPLRRSAGFRIPKVPKIEIRRLGVADAAECGKAALGMVGKGADYAGKAGRSVRVLVGSAMEAGKSAARLRPPQSQVSPWSRLVDYAETADATSRSSNFAADPRLDANTQWQRLTGVVTEGIERAGRVEELHEAAASQLDAVDYAYERMLKELQEVLPGVSQAQVVCRSNREEAYAEISVEAEQFVLNEVEAEPVVTQKRPYMPSRSTHIFAAHSPLSRTAAGAVAA